MSLDEAAAKYNDSLSSYVQQVILEADEESGVDIPIQELDAARRVVDAAVRDFALAALLNAEHTWETCGIGCRSCEMEESIKRLFPEKP